MNIYCIKAAAGSKVKKGNDLKALTGSGLWGQTEGYDMGKKHKPVNRDFRFEVLHEITVGMDRYFLPNHIHGTFYNREMKQTIEYYGSIPDRLDQDDYAVELHYGQEWHNTDTSQPCAVGLRNVIHDNLIQYKRIRADRHSYKTAAMVKERDWALGTYLSLRSQTLQWDFEEIPVKVPGNVKDKRVFLERLAILNYYVESAMVNKAINCYGFVECPDRLKILKQQLKQVNYGTKIQHSVHSVKQMQEIFEDELIQKFVCSIRPNDVFPITAEEHRLIGHIREFVTTEGEDDMEPLRSELEDYCWNVYYQDELYAGMEISWDQFWDKDPLWLLLVCLARDMEAYEEKTKTMEFRKPKYPDCAILGWVWRIGFQELQVMESNWYPATPFRIKEMKEKNIKAIKELDKYNDFDYITEGDFVVKSYLFNCVFQGHKMEDVKALVEIQITGSRDVIEYKARGGYCYNCRQYFILQSEYETIRRIGIPLCEIVEYEEWAGNGGGNYGAEESVLKKYGYNVQAGNGMTDDERRDILVDLVEKGILSRGEIAGYLTFFINNKAGVEKYRNAVEKWMADREFILKYDEEEMWEVRMRKVEYRKISLQIKSQAKF